MPDLGAEHRWMVFLGNSRSHATVRSWRTRLLAQLKYFLPGSQCVAPVVRGGAGSPAVRAVELSGPSTYTYQGHSLVFC